MKTRLASFVFCFVSVALATGALAGCSRAGSRPDELVVYAYDSFTAEWGPGPELSRLFAEKTGVKVTMISCGDAAQVLSRAVLEKRRPGADVLVGIDNNLVDAARLSGVLEPYRSPAHAVVPGDLALDEDWLLTPYDWGYFALIYDSASSVPPPESLEALTRPEYARRLILMDPRTSTPGLGFVAWTVAAYGDGYLSYWERLKPSVLTLAPGWDSGYGLFTSGEAPLVISYTTSPAYHAEYDKTDRYKALIFPEGHPRQIEGLGVVKGCANRAAARAFVDFMLTDDAQYVLPLTQWMYPVSETVVLPESYAAAPRAGKTLEVPPARVVSAVNAVLDALSK